MFLTMAFSDDSFFRFVEPRLLLGCDYLGSINDVGPKTGYSKFKSMAARAMSSSTSGPSAFFLFNHST